MQAREKNILPSSFPFKLQAHLKRLWLSVQELQHWNPLKRHLSAALEMLLEWWELFLIRVVVCCCPIKKSWQSYLLPSIFCESGTPKMIQLQYVFFGREKGCNVSTPCIYAPKLRSFHTLQPLWAARRQVSWGVERCGGERLESKEMN